MYVPFNAKFISKKIQKKFYQDRQESYCKSIIDLKWLDKWVENLEKWFVLNGFAFDHPMTNDEIKVIADTEATDAQKADPLEMQSLAEKIKSEYTQNYLEYRNKLATIPRIQEIMDSYSDYLVYIKSWKPNIFKRIYNYFLSLIEPKND